MKWIFLAILLAAILPLAGWLRRNPHHTPKIWMLMGFLPFVLGEYHLYMAAYSLREWPGHTRGIEISVLDMLAVSVLLSLPRAGQSLPFRLSMILYFLAVMLSVLQTPVPETALFYVWQLARMFLIYTVVVRASKDERVAPALLTGMLIGICYEAGFAFWERMTSSRLQVGGTLGHQNFLGLMSHFVTFPWLALLLAGERGWRPIAGPLAGLVIAILTVSRATVGLMGAGYVGFFILSAMRQWTSRKAFVLALGVVAVFVSTPIVLSSFDQRFSQDETAAGYDSGYDERAAFENAATQMISEHPFGVGANYYVVAANTGGYNSRAHVAWGGASDTANVHNVYFLVTAETGYLGLVTYVFMLLQPLVVAFRCSWRNRRDRRGDFLLGLGMSLLIVYVHSLYEWIFITFQAQYMFAFDIGMVAALATELGYWRSPARRPGNVSGAIEQIAKVARN